jgi:two-component system, OmpR family, response regulator
MARQDHILVVDDDAETRTLLQEYFGKNGFRVSSAADGKGMRAAMSAASPDVVVLDLMLPGEDGLSCAATCARAERAGHHADRARR